MSKTDEGKKSGTGSRGSARERARADAASAQRRGRLMQALVIGGVALVVVGIIGATVIISVLTQGRQTPSADTVVPVGDGVQVPFKVEGSTIRIGRPDAKVKIDLYASYGCSHCKEYDAATSSTFEQVIADGDAVVTYHMIKVPLESQYAPLAGNGSAAVAAHQPQDWLAFHTALFANQSATAEAWQAPQLRDFAGQQRITAPEALAAIDEGRYTSWIAKNTEEAAKAGFTKTPTLLLNGQPSELLPADALAERVRQLAGS